MRQFFGDPVVADDAPDGGRDAALVLHHQQLEGDRFALLSPRRQCGIDTGAERNAAHWSPLATMHCRRSRRAKVAPSAAFPSSAPESAAVMQLIRDLHVITAEAQTNNGASIFMSHLRWQSDASLPRQQAAAGHTVSGGIFSPLPLSLTADLRTDHAGETGAVMIYRGILATSRDADVRRFAEQHLATETGHLGEIEPWLAPAQRSRLLPLWRFAGWLTGALPALVGPRAVYATIEAVETFVDHHYAEQIEAIDLQDPTRVQPQLQALRDLLQRCQGDEAAHRDEAAALFARGGHAPSWVLRGWVLAIGSGSRAAVNICRRV
ncbi:MAG: demethoxyubiquinone hydroxylase family protein [Rubrivivax sp.]|nr:demethoxyubiquinone hydroxylase family protein [Rubrivivax sp.]